jgi:electron transfer flavoprotein alpha subunit
MNSPITIIAEHFEGKIRPVTYELVAFAHEIQKISPQKILVVILETGQTAMADEIAKAAGIDVVSLQHPGLNSYNQEIYVSVLEKWFSKNLFSYLCTAHTTQGMDFAPILSARLNCACITGVESMNRQNSTFFFTRPIFNGKASAKMVSSTPPTILTVQTGIMKFKPGESALAGKVKTESVSPVQRFTRPLGVVRARSDSQTISDADIIISVGRGVGKKENLDLIYRLASLFSKSAVGGSRPLCDLGWLGYSQQIGITGMSVSPRLYMACGISGAVQHLSGIRGADFIVAVNTDPKANIFNMADVCIVEDLTTFIPILIEELKKTPAVGGQP